MSRHLHFYLGHDFPLSHCEDNAKLSVLSAWWPINALWRWQQYNEQEENAPPDGQKVTSLLHSRFSFVTQRSAPHRLTEVHFDYWPHNSGWTLNGGSTVLEIVREIKCISKIQLVVYYQCCVLIDWATTRLYIIALVAKSTEFLATKKD